jgi:proteic killer suppression protein
MWELVEHRNVAKQLRKPPKSVLEKYQIWKDIVISDGPDKLREFPGFHDEKLKGTRSGQRSSRLSLQYRVIYEVERTEVIVYVLELSPHEY